MSFPLQFLNFPPNFVFLLAMPRQHPGNPSKLQKMKSTGAKVKASFSLRCPALMSIKWPPGVQINGGRLIEFPDQLTTCVEEESGHSAGDFGWKMALKQLRWWSSMVLLYSSKLDKCGWIGRFAEIISLRVVNFEISFFFYSGKIKKIRLISVYCC